MRRALRDAGLASLATASLLGFSLMLNPPATVPSGSQQKAVGPLDMLPESGTEVSIALALPAPEEDTVPDDTSDTDSGPAVAEEKPEEVGPADAGPSDGPVLVETMLHLGKGDTVGRVLGKLGLDTRDIAEASRLLAVHVSLRGLPVGQLLRVTLQPAEGVEARPTLHALRLRPEARREITISRDAAGELVVDQELFEAVTKTRRSSGRIEGSVIASAEAAGMPRHPLAEMLRAFSWNVNFQHDIKAGDRFDALVERAWTEDGHAIDGGRLLWAELTTGGGTRRFSVYRFKPRGSKEFFYNEDGESVVTALLRTPLNMSRVSSRFGMRRHPILRFSRFHAGIDFVAPAGTPILAAGAGRVLEAGRNGGYGNWVKIGHANGLATGYAHMSRIGAGVRRSARVRQGQVIGYVGSTGMSTGPHLHFELHRNGKPVDPLGLARTTRSRLTGSELKRFKVVVDEVDELRLSTSSEQ